MSTEKKAKLPAYRIFSVSKNGDQKARWTEIGFAWAHKDKKGFNLVFSARPLEGAEIVLRVAKAKKGEERSSRQTLGRYDGLRSDAEGGAQ